jgi:hypothetical protein
MGLNSSEKLAEEGKLARNYQLTPCVQIAEFRIFIDRR